MHFSRRLCGFPDDGYYDGRYDRRDRGYDYRYDQDRRYDRQRWEYEQQRKDWNWNVAKIFSSVTGNRNGVGK